MACMCVFICVCVGGIRCGLHVCVWAGGGRGGTGVACLHAWPAYACEHVHVGGWDGGNQCGLHARVESVWPTCMSGISVVYMHEWACL